MRIMCIIARWTMTPEVIKREDHQKEITKMTEKVIQLETTDAITMKLNDEKNGVELYFNDIPSEEIRTQLKSNSFKWSRFNKCWYANQNERTLAVADRLSNRKIDAIDDIEPIEIELVELVDIFQFKINEETEIRLISNSLMQNRKEGYETKQLQLTLSNLLEDTKKVIEMADANYSKNILINGFNAFCERYTRELNSYLYQRSVNPSWAVTGRGGLNIARYNKKQDQLHNKLGKLIEMLEKQKSVLEKYNNKFKQHREYKAKKAIEHAINNLDNVTISFSTQKREMNYYGYKYNTRSYESPNYFFMKMAGCYRIFERATSKEIHSMKTKDKLSDAKNHVIYLENKRVIQNK